MRTVTLLEPGIIGMKIETDLPDDVKGFEYFVNSHYLKITKFSGDTIKLVPASLLRGECEECHNVCYVESNYGEMACPHCRGKVDWIWSETKMAFVPEHVHD